MSEEMKSETVTATAPFPAFDQNADTSTVPYPAVAQNVDTMNPVSKFDQSKDPIPKVVPPRGSKDARSFRPSTLAEINMMNKYEPLTVKCGSRSIAIACGNSLEDFLLLCGCIFALWSFILGLSSLLLKSALDTDMCDTFLFLFFLVLASSL